MIVKNASNKLDIFGIYSNFFVTKVVSAKFKKICFLHFLGMFWRKQFL
jgi:hypothetical protein